MATATATKTAVIETLGTETAAIETETAVIETLGTETAATKTAVIETAHTVKKLENELLTLNQEKEAALQVLKKAMEDADAITQEVANAMSKLEVARVEATKAKLAMIKQEEELDTKNALKALPDTRQRLGYWYNPQMKYYGPITLPSFMDRTKMIDVIIAHNHTSIYRYRRDGCRCDEWAIKCKSINGNTVIVYSETDPEW
jgi:hypothetical protein